MSTKKLLPKALSIYEKFENNQIRLSDLDREDLHFKLKTAADILIEENGIHVTNPFKFSVEDIYNWSLEENKNFGIVLDEYQKTYNKKKKEFDNSIQPTYKPYFKEKLDNAPKKPDEIINYSRKRIQHLRKYDGSVDGQLELKHRRENIFDVLYFQSNKNLENLMVKTYLDDLTMTNNVTVLQSVGERDEKTILKNGEEKTLPENYTHKQRKYSIGELIEVMSDPTQNEFTKDKRPIVFPLTSGRRKTGDIAYTEWSGLQVFDLDLKFSPTFVEKYGDDASKVRDKLFDKLKHYPWLLGITLSASGRGCHVYTKVSRMHHIFERIEDNIEHSKYWYRMSYIQKHAAIAYILSEFCSIDIYNEDHVIDTSLAKIGQGIAMNYDPEARWSTNFVDLYPTIFYHVPPEDGIKPEEWLLTPKILNDYKSWFYQNAVLDDDNVDVQKNQGDIKLIVDEKVSKDGVSQINMNKLEKGQKYTTRWRIVNTIVYAFGDKNKTRELCHHILQTKKTHTENSIESFIRSAVMNQKEADMGTIKQLNKLGLEIGIEDDSVEELSDDTLSEIKFSLENSDYDFTPIQPNKTINLDDGEYLGMRMKEVLSSIKDFKLNVIESAPNTGKTEFFKSLAKTKKVCLVIPFTSTIDSKIVYDDEIQELFDVFYGERSIREVEKGKSAVMTFDKFSVMPKSKYDIFDYIAIDESHLLFTSAYRLSVVSQTIENIRTYLNQDVSEVRDYLSSVMSIQNLMGFVHDDESNKQMTKFILMTGTVTGELDYFNFYDILNYITVRKEHPHKKESIINIGRTPKQRDAEIYHRVSENLEKGVKIIHPTNKGDAYVEKMVACVEYILDRKIKYEYYKKANKDEDFLKNINLDTTTNDIELLFCTDYLSVGIDIKDKSDFKIIYSNDFTGESIEQFNNRLRSTDIDCEIFYDVVDDEGGQKPNIINTKKINYVHNDELSRMIADERSIAILEKNIQTENQYFAILGELFSKYFIQDFAGNIKYIRSAFEIEQFEIQYKSIAKSLLYIKSSLDLKYNYDVSVQKIGGFEEKEIARFDVVKDAAKNTHDSNKTKSFIELVNFMGRDDIYETIKTDSLKFEKDNTKIEESDIGLHFGLSSEEGDDGFVLTWNKKHKIMIEKSKIFVKKMRKLYSRKTTNQIVRSCLKKSGVLNKTEIERYQKLVNLIFDDRKMTLSKNTKELLKTSYEYVNPKSGNVSLDRIIFEDMKMDLKEKSLEIFKEMTEKEIKSQRRHDNIDNLINKFVDTLFKKRVGRDSVNIEFRKIYNFDSMFIQMKMERDKIYKKILLNQTPEQMEENDTNWISTNHFEQDKMIVS